MIIRQTYLNKGYGFGKTTQNIRFRSASGKITHKTKIYFLYRKHVFRFNRLVIKMSKFTLVNNVAFIQKRIMSQIPTKCTHL